MRRAPSLSRWSCLLLVTALFWAPPALAQEPPQSQPTTTAPDDAPLPLRRDNGVLTPSRLTRVGMVLLLGIVLALLASLVLRRLLRRPVRGSGRRIDIVEARRATPQLTLVLVRIGDKELLVGQTGNGVALLHAQALGDDSARAADD